ncbi:MAG: PqiC family protein [Myxococcota bacterium]
MRSTLLSMALGLAALGAVACGSSDAARLYTLSQMPDTQPLTPAATRNVVGIGPVTLPPYLHRTAIVTRSSPYRVELATFDRWAEPLDTVVLRVLTENVSDLLGSDHVYPNPRRHREPEDLAVEIEFTRFEAIGAGVVRLAAHWAIYRGNQDKPLAEGKVQFNRESDSDSDDDDDDRYDQQARLLSEALGSLSVTIAEAIVAIP